MSAVDDYYDLTLTEKIYAMARIRTVLSEEEYYNSRVSTFSTTGDAPNRIMLALMKECGLEIDEFRR